MSSFCVVPTAVREAGDEIFPGFGSVLVTVALLGLVTITGIQFYGASLTIMSIVDSLRPLSRSTRAKRIATLVVVAAVVSMAIAFGASADFLHQFSEFLTILLYLFTPWTAINLVDFYLVRHTHYLIRDIFNPRGMYQRWSWRGLAAYGLGFVAMIPFMKTGIFDGPVTKLLDGTDLR